MAAPEFCREGDALTWLWHDEGYRITLDRFSDRFGALHAELLVESIKLDRNGRAGHVHWSSLGLASTNERQAIQRKLSGQDSAVNWAMILELSCLWAARIRREGEPMVDLARGNGVADVAPREYVMHKILPAGEVSLIYGDGSSGKSLLVQAVALACRLGRDLPGGLRCPTSQPAIYYDWETNAAVIQRRMRRFCAGWGAAMPTMHYVSMRHPLIDDIARMRSDVARVGAGLVIIDSLGFAMGGSDLKEADATTRLFNELRSLNTTVLAVHHLSKAAAEQNVGAVKPYGSGYFYNAARNAWEVRSRADADDLVMSLWHRKDNDGRLITRPIGLKFAFDQESGPIVLASTDIDDDKELIAHGGLSYHLQSLLRTGALTIADLAEATGYPKEAVARTLRRTPGVVNLTPGVVGRGKAALWGLAAKE